MCVCVSGIFCFHYYSLFECFYWNWLYLLLLSSMTTVFLYTSHTIIHWWKIYIVNIMDGQRMSLIIIQNFIETNKNYDWIEILLTGFSTRTPQNRGIRITWSSQFAFQLLTWNIKKNKMNKLIVNWVLADASVSISQYDCNYFWRGSTNEYPILLP